MMFDLIASHDAMGNASAYTLLVNWHAIHRLMAVDVPTFLAWWMPLNLCSWLAMMAFGTLQGGELNTTGRSLVWQLLMTVAFWPMLTFVALAASWVTTWDSIRSVNFSQAVTRQLRRGQGELSVYQTYLHRGGIR